MKICNNDLYEEEYMEGNELCVLPVQWIADVIKSSNGFEKHNFRVNVEEYKRNGFKSLCVLYY